MDQRAGGLPGNGLKQGTDFRQIANYLGRQEVLILDGGLATELERRGANLRHELWSARMLIENPELIRQVHLDYLRAGADIITSASYQASIGGFERAGLDKTAAATTMRSSVTLACEAREAFCEEDASRNRLRPLVAASIGPYGACLADGSEYGGDYGLGKQALIDFHRPRMEILADSGADLYAIETIPSLLEAEALLELLAEFPGIEAWLSFSCRDEVHVSHGERFSECARLADTEKQVVAIGVNCTDPAFVTGLLRSAGQVQTPLLAYPNSGETWNAEDNSWMGEGRAALTAAEWVDAGARLVGGCCRVGPGQISRLRKELPGER